MFALFDSLGGFELVVVAVAALLVFGKDLPRVAAQLGSQFAKFKRSLDSAWRESGVEKELRDIKNVLPRDLSVADVARAASEKLAVRLDEANRPEPQQPIQPGAVPRGAPEEPVPSSATPDGAPQLATDPAASSPESTTPARSASATPAALPGPVGAPAAPWNDEAAATDLHQDPRRSGLHEGERPPPR